MKYDESSFTYGYEIEWGDIDRNIEIPTNLGSWEYCETDIVNLNGDYKYIACDPQGIIPPYGGEINTKPTKTIGEQVSKIMDIYELFIDNGDSPTSSCINHGHLHIHVPELKNDIESLKKLTKYVYENQDLTVKECYDFKSDASMKELKATQYLKLDGGRLLPEYVYKNIMEKSTDFNSFIKMHCAGKDGISMGRPFRYAINMYNMKHIGTIEFRCFRSSTIKREIEDSLKFASLFIESALGDGKPVDQILSENDFQFPKFNYSYEEFKGWKETKWDKSRGTKRRQFYEVK